MCLLDYKSARETLYSPLFVDKCYIVRSKELSYK